MTQTANLVLEVLCEEIPARMQAGAADKLKGLFLSTLENHGLKCGAAEGFITPRRLILHVQDIPTQQEDRQEEKKGPRVGSPDKAIEGFLTSVGLESVDQCQIQNLPKGDFYISNKFIKGQQTEVLLPQIIKEALDQFTWPKSMRWARNSMAWVRPLRSIFCLFNGEPVEGRIDLGYDQISFTSDLLGHRFHSEAPFTAHDFETYKQRMLHHHVIIDQEERKQTILQQITKLASDHGVTLRKDPGLLEEVTGLVEWPNAFIGNIEKEFMELPDEVLITSMRVHQKYFALENAHGQLAHFFIIVSNIEPKDGGKAVIEGNERVLRARLSDAKFFYELDQKLSLREHSKKLSQSIFHADLGSMEEKMERVEQLGSYIADLVSVDQMQVVQAASISKSDLVTEMVKEFPELQGIMGYHYALLEGKKSEVAEAIADHYKPKGANDDLPRSQVGTVLALADKIDTIVGMFSVGIKPTGSKDPYALRRAALGSIRLLETLDDVQLDEIVSKSYQAYKPVFDAKKQNVLGLGDLVEEVRLFFLDRLKVHWREQGLRHDYISAVFSIATDEPFSLLARRVQSLNDYLGRSDGSGDQLLAAYRRASNIVRIEEKKDNITFDHNVNPDLLKEETEQTLYKELNESLQPIRASIGHQEYEKAMEFVANLRPHIDEFFDQVTVNTKDPSVRANRLRLLSLIRDTLHQVADFSKIEG